MMNALNTVEPAEACICGWNTPDHNADTHKPKDCPAVKAATKRLFDDGYTTTKQTRWTNYWIQPEDVAIVVLTALREQHEAALAAQAEQFESEQLADVVPIRPGIVVKTASSPLNLDPHETYYRPPYIGRAYEVEAAA